MPMIADIILVELKQTHYKGWNTCAGINEDPLSVSERKSENKKVFVCLVVCIYLFLEISFEKVIIIKITLANYDIYYAKIITLLLNDS